MTKRHRNGPGVFLVALGSVVLLSGAMTFLALPAARRMDAKEADQEGKVPGVARQRGIAKGGAYAAGAGGAMVVTGVFLVLRRPQRT